MTVNISAIPSELPSVVVGLGGSRVPVNSTLMFSAGSSLRPGVANAINAATKFPALAGGATQLVLGGNAGSVIQINYVYLWVSAAIELQIIDAIVFFYVSLPAASGQFFSFAPNGLRCTLLNDGLSIKNNSVGAADVIISVAGSYVTT